MSSAIALDSPARSAPAPLVLARAHAAELALSRFIDHPSGYLALSARNERYTVDGVPGFIAFRAQGRHLVTLGGVHAPELAWPTLLDGFLAFAALHKRRVVAVQLREAQAPLYRSRGFTVNRFGASYSLALDGFSLAGTKRMKLRNKIKRARAAGLRVVELGRDLPRDEQRFAALREVSAAWLAGKARPELDFMIGELGAPTDEERRVFVALRGDQIAGFITYVPSWGARPGWLHDLTRRRPDAPTGTMELLNAVAIERFVAEGARWLHFGFTPFVVEGAEGPGASSLLAWGLRALWRWGQAIYPARSQVDYKLKWGPSVVEPELVACAPLSVRAVVDLLRVTRSL